jgi:hypothetical protein
MRSVTALSYSVSADRPAHETTDAEIIGPEGGIESVAKLLFDELVHKDLIVPSKWEDLAEGDRLAYRSVVEGLILSWRDLRRARAEMRDPA